MANQYSLEGNINAHAAVFLVLPANCQRTKASDRKTSGISETLQSLSKRVFVVNYAIL